MAQSKFKLWIKYGDGWLRFAQPHILLSASQPADVLPVLAELDRQVQATGLWAAGLVSYEAAPAFDPAFPAAKPSSFPLLQFGLFSPPQSISLPAAPAAMLAPAAWTPSVTQEEYTHAIHTIKEAISSGYTYQVNYTLRLNAGYAADPWPWFLNWAHASQSPYAAYLETDQYTLLSASPELFWALNGNIIQSRPMKGTTRRGLYPAQDQEQARWLLASEKNRAENLMIVDMVRNDLGKIARTGSVHVPHLFTLERYPTLWTMTSTIAAETSATLPEIMQAMFPFASITGAPKRSTLQIISDLETTPRRAYTGTLGFLAPGRTAQFNVLIRSVLIEPAQASAEYGVGGGVVWDSTADDEYAECLLKASQLSQPYIAYDLLETLLWTPTEGFFLLENHLDRLSNSAAYFGFKLELDQLRLRLAQMAEVFRREAPTIPGKPGDPALEPTQARLPGRQRVRLLLSRSGEIKLESAPLPRADKTLPPLRISLAASPVEPGNVFLYHKTTNRQVYNAALAAHPQAEDVILWNPAGEVTETCLANIFVQFGDGLFTPPVECGLLPGTFRRNLLATGLVTERVIRTTDLATAERIFIGNSVRGLLPATII